MKHIKYFSNFLIFFIAMYFVACADMEDTYKEFVIDRTYTGRPDSLLARGGENRIELSWLLLSDPKISSYKISWNNKQDSILGGLVKTEDIDTVRVILDDLNEDLYYFEVTHYDENKNPSVTVTTIGQAYGERYKNSLLNRLFAYRRVQNDLAFAWSPADDEVAFVELMYNDEDGNAVRYIVENDVENDTIKNFPVGGSFSYRTAYLPEPLALDTFYSQYNTVFADPEVAERQPLDMVLIYTGGSNRATGWFNAGHFSPFIALNRENGTFDWLFDGFLFLEIRDGEKSFFGSHGSIPANKEDWTSYMDKFVAPYLNISALNNQLEVFKNRSGATSSFEKRKIIIGIPEAKEGQKDWGSLDGRALDFDIEEDRIAAYKWFVDYAMGKFDAQNYENLELVAFYWIQEGERIENTIKAVSDYIHDKDYYFYWIPHILGADNVNNNWKELGFDRAYLQPGYFYRTDADYWRLVESAQRVNTHQFLPYVEFSPQALVSSENWGYRLDNTIDVFNLYGFWDSHPVGYYQSFDAWHRLFYSTNQQDKDLYNRLAEIVARRQRYK